MINPKITQLGNEVIVEEYFNFDTDNHHRLDGPAIIIRENNVIVSQIYYDNGKYHRLDGPAYIYTCTITGKIKYEYWYQDKIFTSLKKLKVYAKLQILI